MEFADAQRAVKPSERFAEVDAELLARGFSRMVFDRSKLRELLDALGNPEKAYRSVHLTGTNGKTSTARMVESLLRAHGLRTGRYTSPHLETVRERITIDGEMVSEERFVEIYDDVAPLAALIDARHPETMTYFDMTTALALAGFADAPVDVAVVEVGLGGASDSTNVLDAGTCVITPIGLDHTEWLGDTVADIAWEKVAIVQEGATLVCAQQPEEAMEAILEHCAEVGATVAREGHEFYVAQRGLAVGGQVLQVQGLGGVYDQIYLPLHGAHQAQNAALALATVEAFLGAGKDKGPLDIEVVREGFAQVTSPGRLEKVRNAPAILLDAAHNPAGMAATTQALAEEFDFGRLVAVFAALGDKDVSGMLELLEPVCDAIVLTVNSSDRAMPVSKIQPIAEEIFGAERVQTAPHLADAIEVAIAEAESREDVSLGAIGLIITGSVMTVADARKLLVRKKP
ncbi:bifunctional folylpolyglutamate synthase/dihydrofolate synthase [Longispora albida]|uniref:bifunctional folylpolyglutamate synthase/dihydrofolate synthase n=1 Tax=Longispora albida TaxID=203523 RepID=UPI000367A3F4|nr:folylpolyglutamate synthase/dihydrofolate synthase family protein [Longispora albida]